MMLYQYDSNKCWCMCFNTLFRISNIHLFSFSNLNFTRDDEQENVLIILLKSTFIHPVFED